LFFSKSKQYLDDDIISRGGLNDNENFDSLTDK